MFYQWLVFSISSKPYKMSVRFDSQKETSGTDLLILQYWYPHTNKQSASLSLKMNGNSWIHCWKHLCPLGFHVPESFHGLDLKQSNFFFPLINHNMATQLSWGPIQWGPRVKRVSLTEEVITRVRYPAECNLQRQNTSPVSHLSSLCPSVINHILL